MEFIRKHVKYAELNPAYADACFELADETFAFEFGQDELRLMVVGA